MRVLAAAFMFLVVTSLPVCAETDLEEFGPEFHMTAFCSDGPMCETEQKQLQKEWPKALKGDYQSQRNIGFCLRDGCYGAVQKDDVQSCAWRIVLLASGSGRIVPVDFNNYSDVCLKVLTPIQFATARAQASRLYPAIYRKPLPPGPWSP